MNTKQKILKIASEFLLERDYNSISLSMIADKIGIKKPSIYYHFISKNDLYSKVYEQIIFNFNNEFKEIEKSKEDAETKIKEFLTLFLFNSYRKRINLKSFLMERLTEKKNICHSEDIREEILKKLNIFLLQYEKEKQIKINKRDIAISILGVSGALMADLLMSNKKIIKKDFKIIADKVILILLKQYE